MPLKLIIPTLIVSLAFVGCGRKAAPPPPAPPEVGVVAVTAEPVNVITELPGRIDPVRVAEVRARVAGILLEKTFSEGADVKAGDVLFKIDPAPFQAAVNSAKATVASAEANLKRAQSEADRFKELVEINAVSRQDYDNAVATVSQNEASILVAKAALERAELDLGYATVRSPIAGHIGRGEVTEGALVGQNESTLLAVVQQLDPIYFDFTQSSTEVLQLQRALRSGQLKSLGPGEAKVTLLLEDGSVYPHPGKLLFTDLTVSESTGSILLRAEFPNPNRELLPGMFARGRLEQAVNSEALTLPQRAVAREANGASSVLLVNGENKVESRRIQTGNAVGNKWVINEGLKAGDKVIAEGQLKVRPGAVVKPVPYDPDAKSGNQPAPPAPAAPASGK